MIVGMNKDYPSFVNEPTPEPDYDCRKLKVAGYILRARCNKNNPDCEKYIEKLRQENDSVKIEELDTVQYGNDMVDVWVRKQNPFGKIA